MTDQGKLSIWVQWSWQETQLPTLVWWLRKPRTQQKPLPFHSVLLPLLQATQVTLRKGSRGCTLAADISLAGTYAGGRARKVAVHLYNQIIYSINIQQVPTMCQILCWELGWLRGIDSIHIFKGVRILAGEGQRVNKQLNGNGIREERLLH